MGSTSDGSALKKDENSSTFDQNAKFFYDNLCRKTFDLTPNLKCIDSMAEFKLTFNVPLQILRLSQANFQLLRDLLSNFAREKFKMAKILHLKRLDFYLERYGTIEKFLDQYSGPNFKASVLKDNVEYSFVATNLHIQRFEAFLNGKQSDIADKSHSRMLTCLYSLDLMQNRIMRKTGAPVLEGEAEGSCGLNKLTPIKVDQDCDTIGDALGTTIIDKIRHDCVTCGAFTAFSDGYDQGGCFKMKEKLYENFLGNDTRKIVDSDFATIVAFLNDFSRLRRRLEEFSSIFKSKSWLDMNADQMESFAENLQKCAISFKEQLITKYDLDDHQDPKEESLESQLLDLEAELACLQAKTQNFSLYTLESEIDVTKNMTSSKFTLSHNNEYKSSLHQSTFNILQRMENLSKSIGDCLSAKFLESLNNEQLINLYYDLINRRNCIISQGLTVVCCSILHEIYANFAGKWEIWRNCGTLISVHSFLSCYHEEKGMIEDLSEALTLIGQNCRFHILKSFSQIDDVCQILIDGQCPSSGVLKITLPLNEKFLQPSFPESGFELKIHPILFTVGLNYEETLAKTMGGLNLERQLNQKALEHYEFYVRKFLAHSQDADLAKKLQAHLDNLRTILAQNSWKNVEIFQISRHLNHLLQGQLILCCKSGKDRTAMAVTCDQAEILFEENLLRDRSMIHHTLDIIRSLGTRLENTLKNVGARRYAFTQLQLSFMPQNYRPPKGTFGKGQT